MDCIFKRMKEEVSQCSFDELDFQKCPFLRNINKPTHLSFVSQNLPIPTPGFRGPIFEDGPNFDMAFKLFHGRNGVVPLGSSSNLHDDFHPEPEPAPKFNPLAVKTATISLSAFGPGGPFSFDSFSDKWKNQKNKAEQSKKKDKPSQSDGSASHEAVGNEWLQNGNCPIAKSYRAVSHVMPLVAKALKPPAGMKYRCPPAIVAARAALAKTELAKNLRPQPLPEKMFSITALGMAVNVPLGMWREHTHKFSPSWFMAVHAAVPFIAMLRKAILMPKTAMAITLGASILGQSIGARAERLRLKAVAERKGIIEKTTDNGLLACNTVPAEGIGVNCAKEQLLLATDYVNKDKQTSSRATVCF
ncbi:hypothetical protein V2J09_000875 [Rumex salicifolius]